MEFFGAVLLSTLICNQLAKFPLQFTTESIDQALNSVPGRWDSRRQESLVGFETNWTHWCGPHGRESEGFCRGNGQTRPAFARKLRRLKSKCENILYAIIFGKNSGLTYQIGRRTCSGRIFLWSIMGQKFSPLVIYVSVRFLFEIWEEGWCMQGYAWKTKNGKVCNIRVGQLVLWQLDKP